MWVGNGSEFTGAQVMEGSSAGFKQVERPRENSQQDHRQKVPSRSGMAVLIGGISLKMVLDEELIHEWPAVFEDDWGIPERGYGQKDEQAVEGAQAEEAAQLSRANNIDKDYSSYEQWAYQTFGQH